MELRQLLYFVEAARVGSFLGAAECLDVAQPTLWRQVKALEGELGFSLFERSGRGVRITSTGSYLLPRVEQLLRSADAVRALSDELAQGRTGVVTVACAHPHVTRFLAPLFASFRETHPDIHIALRETSSMPPVDVLTGDVDFVSGLPRAGGGLAGRHLGKVRLVVVTADDHPWRHRVEIPTSELRGVSVLIGPAGSLSRQLLEPVLREKDGFVLDIAHESGYATTLFALARVGLGVGVLADDNLGMDSPSTWPILVDHRYRMSANVWIFWLGNRELAPSVREFAQHVENSLPAV